jgi:hypothetical protein
MKLPKRLAGLLLAIWLIAWGAVQLVPALAFSGSGTALAALAVVAGILLLLER